MKLNLGCGAQVVDGWVNVDYALGARFSQVPLFRGVNRRLGLFHQDWDDRIFIHDLTKPFPWDDCCADVVYSSHILEHFSKADGLTFLGECHRVLRQDGVIRIVVPDLHEVFRDYEEGRLPADDVLFELNVLPGNSTSAMKNRLAPFLQFPHKCMYDHPRLLAILDDIGFEAAARPAFDSAIDDIRDIELEERTQRAVVVEGHKR